MDITFHQENDSKVVLQVAQMCQKERHQSRKQDESPASAAGCRLYILKATRKYLTLQSICMTYVANRARRTKMVKLARYRHRVDRRAISLSVEPTPAQSAGVNVSTPSFISS
jgi:hypothetical protein